MPLGLGDGTVASSSNKDEGRTWSTPRRRITSILIQFARPGNAEEQEGSILCGACPYRFVKQGEFSLYCDVLELCPYAPCDGTTCSEGCPKDPKSATWHSMRGSVLSPRYYRETQKQYNQVRLHFWGKGGRAARWENRKRVKDELLSLAAKYT